LLKLLQKFNEHRLLVEMIFPGAFVFDPAVACFGRNFIRVDLGQARRVSLAANFPTGSFGGSGM
jgi:hypothetical protein